MHQSGLFKAIKYFGSQRGLAKALGTSQQTISYWLNGSRKMPYEYALQLFIRSKGYITLESLVSSTQPACQDLEQVSLFRKFPAESVAVDQVRENGLICPKYPTADHLLAQATEAWLATPILLDSQDQVISCVCRIHAHRLLGRSHLLAHHIDMPKVLQMPSWLGKLAQTFVVSERVTLGLAVERHLGYRQGQRQDIKPVDTYPQVDIGSKSRMLVAKVAGFGSDFSYRQAKWVVQHGSPAIIEKMDDLSCSINQAYQLAKLAQ